MSMRVGIAGTDGLGISGINGATRDSSWIGFGPDPNQAMLEEFVGSIRENRDSSVTWSDGYQAMRVALAAYESARTGQPAAVDSA